MRHRKTGLALTVLAGLMLAIAAPAQASAAAKDPKPTRTTIQLFSPTSLSGKPLKPGSYRLVADETKVTIEQDGKLVAEASMHWKDAPTKAAYSTVVFDDRGIREFHFEGKTRYIEIAD